MPILDAHTRLDELVPGRFHLTAFSRSTGGPYRQLDGVWGSLEDHFDWSFSPDGFDLSFTRNGDGILVRPFARYRGSDTWAKDLRGLVTAEPASSSNEHELKFGVKFTDPLGRFSGAGFEFSPIGGATLVWTTEPVAFANGGAEVWQVPVVEVSVGGVVLFRFSTEALLRFGPSSGWRPVRDGNRVRISFPTTGQNQVLDIDPTASITKVAGTNGWIEWIFPDNDLGATVSGSVKQIGRFWTSGGSPQLRRYNGYDRFDLSALHPDAIILFGNYFLTAGNQPYFENGFLGSGGPDNSVWKMYFGWNVLSDPLVSSDLWSVRDQPGRFEQDYDTLELHDPGPRELYQFLVPVGWIRGGTSELHDIEIMDFSAYDPNSDWRYWLVFRTGPTPRLEIEYILLPEDQTTILDPLSANLSAPVVSAIPGEATTILDASEIATTAPSVALTPGAISMALGTLITIVSAEAVSPSPGELTLALEPAIADLSASSVALVAEAVTIALKAANVALGANTVTSLGGDTTIGLSPASVDLSAGTQTFVFGAVSVTISAATGALVALEVTAEAGALVRVCPVEGEFRSLRDLAGSSKRVGDVLGSSLRVTALEGDIGCECV